MQVLPFDKKYNRNAFYCDVDSLNNYIHHQVSQDIRKKLATCFVILDDKQNIIAYYTLSSSGLKREVIPDKFKKRVPHHYSIPVILLGRLAIDNKHTGKGLGEFLLINALKRALETSEKSIGAMAVIVDPIDHLAFSFYEKYGFITLEDSGKMFLPMHVIKKLP